jgi:hypothetical protein
VAGAFEVQVTRRLGLRQSKDSGSPSLLGPVHNAKCHTTHRVELGISGRIGYSWVKKAISMRGQDLEMEFAAALLTLSGPETDHRDHAQKTLAGATNDSLLAQNLASLLNLQTASASLNDSSAGGPTSKYSPND